MITMAPRVTSLEKGKVYGIGRGHSMIRATLSPNQGIFHGDSELGSMYVLKRIDPPYSDFPVYLTGDKFVNRTGDPITIDLYEKTGESKD